MNMERNLHPKSSVPRIYLPRHLEGSGQLSLERLHNRVVLATAYKPMHGTFYKHLEEHGLSEQLIFSFLSPSGLKSEGFIMACENSVFNALVYRGRVSKITINKIWERFVSNLTIESNMEDLRGILTDAEDMLGLIDILSRRRLQKKYPVR
nr:unnamed protein product [Callosobruchus analis]